MPEAPDATAASPAGAVSVRGGGAGFWLALALGIAALFWIANGVAAWDGDKDNAWHHYEYLTDGFLSGHTYLSVEPSSALLALPDPYNPAASRPYRIWDASLYRGKFYLYYGPVPALVLMLPWKVLTGHQLPQRLAVAVFAALGLAGLARLLWEVRARHFPSLSGTALGAIWLVALHASWMPVILRRPAFWELPIVAAVACLWWALYFLWKFHDSGGRAGWAAGCGAALALLLGCRVTYLFSAAVVLALLLVPTGAAPGPAGARPKWSAAALAASLVCLGGLALLAYNWERFGKVSEFGQSYQLWGYEERDVRHFSLGYAPFNAWLYLFSTPELSPYFPFIRGAWPERLPDGYISIEEMQGIVFAAPVQLAGIAAILWAVRRRADAAGRPLRLVLAGGAVASILAAVVLFCWAGACSRYIAELSAGWTVVSAVGLMAIFAPCARSGSERSGSVRNALRLLAILAAGWTVVYTWLASADFREFMRQTNPKVYGAVAHLLDYPSQRAARKAGVEFGPLDLTVRVYPSRSGASATLVASGRPAMMNDLILERVDASHVRLKLVENEFTMLETQPLATPGDRLRLRLEAPWLYPPAAHPYWDGFRNPKVAGALQTLFRITVDGKSYAVASGYCFDSTRFEPYVLSTAAGRPLGAGVESIERVGVRMPP